MRWQWIAICFILVGCTMAYTPSSSEVMPTPVSHVMTQFIRQTDGNYGYAMMRPSDWKPIDMGDSRGFYPAEMEGKPDRLLLLAVNYQTLATHANGDAAIVQYDEFKQSPSFDAWMTKRETAWREMDTPFSLVQKSSGSATYALTTGVGEVNLITYTIAHNQPLAVALSGYGKYSDMTTLRDEGILQDYLAIAASVATADNSSVVEPPLDE